MFGNVKVKVNGLLRIKLFSSNKYLTHKNNKLCSVVDLKIRKWDNKVRKL
jgi:hypothetical protein